MPYDSRDQRLRKTYGMTAEQWDKMYDLQQGKCPICDKPIRRPGNKEGRRAACVDHDHKTGRVRGLVHDRCNRFRIAGNTVETATKLLNYLASEFDGRKI